MNEGGAPGRKKRPGRGGKDATTQQRNKGPEGGVGGADMCEGYSAERVVAMCGRKMMTAVVARSRKLEVYSIFLPSL